MDWYVQLAGVNRTHEQIANSGAVQRLVEERTPPVQNGFLQRTLDDVVVDESLSCERHRPKARTATRHTQRQSG